MKKFASVSEYIASFPKETRAVLQELRKVIKKSAPKAEECLSYGMPAYRQGGVLVYFAAYKNHIGFYPTASGVATFKKDILKYKYSKGTIQFPITTKLPFTLIRKIVKFRVKENDSKVGL